ncbi:hypothetical protein HanPSC8_Chr12g0521251 [Helianthus annuus]|nr:hypothetical protein HanPSC8_Chr12g0521251 [Helianthus annuus]
MLILVMMLMDQVTCFLLLGLVTTMSWFLLLAIVMEQASWAQVLVILDLLFMVLHQ